MISPFDGNPFPHYDAFRHFISNSRTGTQLNKFIAAVRSWPSRLSEARYLPWALAAALLAVALCLANLALHHDGDITKAIRVGSDFYYQPGVGNLVRKAEPTLDPLNGFDGQFYFFLAFDPLLHEPATIRALDAPHLRARRIFYPLVSRLMVIHRSDIPMGLLASLLLSIIGSAVIAGDFLKRAGLSPLWSAVVPLSVCFAVPVDYLTCEPLAIFLIMLALWAWARERFVLAWLATAAAILTKEPSGALALAFAAMAAKDRRWKRAAIFLVAAAPFVLWAQYIKTRIDAPVGLDMGKNFMWPLEGALRVFPHDWAKYTSGENEKVYMLRMLTRLWFLAAAVALIIVGLRGHRGFRENWRPSAAGVLGILAAVNAFTLSSGEHAPSYDWLAHFARQLYLVPPALFVLWIETRNRFLARLLLIQPLLALLAWRLLISGKFI